MKDRNPNGVNRRAAVASRQIRRKTGFRILGITPPGDLPNGTEVLTLHPPVATGRTSLHVRKAASCFHDQDRRGHQATNASQVQRPKRFFLQGKQCNLQQRWTGQWTASLYKPAGQKKLMASVKRAPRRFRIRRNGLTAAEPVIGDSAQAIFRMTPTPVESAFLASEVIPPQLACQLPGGTTYSSFTH